MSIEFNLGLVAGSLSSLKPLPVFRRFGSSADSKYKASTGDIPHELDGVGNSRTKSDGRKNPRLGMWTKILEESANGSQERIFPTSE